VARAPDDAHADVSCATCHDGPLAERGEAAVPAETCTASGCHADEGPQQVQLAAVTFDHRNHAGDSVVVMGCAGCHSHARGEERLTANVDACSLCHLNQQAAGLAGECRTCHGLPEHQGLTSQGVEIPHAGLPWIEGGCIRCHYDVTEPPVDVAVARCGACHQDLEAAIARGIGEDLHQSHVGSSCTSCHEEGTHRIRAMTSAVDLACVDCHDREHDVALAGEFPGPATCNDCHAGVHEPQQRMVLGLVDDLSSPTPSEKFMDGLTCRSCHQPAAGTAADEVVRGAAASCVACHRAEYETVLNWWRVGGSDRLARTEAFVRTAVGRIGTTGDSAATGVAAAERMVALVREGGAVHNLPLAHRLLRDASERVVEAYDARGIGAAPPPDLGRQPSMGLCTYCHYRPNDPWLYQEMNDAFHREVLGIR
jgi:predicted CXXCH cytochrome family protein